MRHAWRLPKPAAPAQYADCNGRPVTPRSMPQCIDMLTAASEGGFLFLPTSVSNGDQEVMAIGRCGGEQVELDHDSPRWATGAAKLYKAMLRQHVCNSARQSAWAQPSALNTSNSLDAHQA